MILRKMEKIMKQKYMIEKEQDLDILFTEAKNEKDTVLQIEQYENIIDLEMSTSKRKKLFISMFRTININISFLIKQR